MKYHKMRRYIKLPETKNYYDSSVFIHSFTVMYFWSTHYGPDPIPAYKKYHKKIEENPYNEGAYTLMGGRQTENSNL